MVNLVDLIETEDTRITNPGGYFGPEVNPFGVVMDNRDDETHTPETDAEFEKRKKKKKKQLEPTADKTEEEKVTESKSVEKLLNDPEVQALLTHLLKKSLMSNVTKTDQSSFYEEVVNQLASALIEAGGTVGPISKEREKELDTFPEEEVKKGIEVEKEHTDNEEVAKNVVLDHLKEMRKKGKKSNYYELLKKYVEGDKAS